jgi:diguanylate cyclase (GGDEF)-like protein
MSLVEILPGQGHLGGEERAVENVVTLKLPARARRKEVMGWAMEQVADAERRVAALQERIAYLESLSVTDELTGLLNRRGFMWELSRTLATAKRGGPHGVVLLCDLDGFKGVNDRWGHAAGDEVLRRTGAVLSNKTRRSDIVARIGGDEFSIVLVGAGLVAARRKAQGLAAHIVEAAAAAVAGESVTIGVSFGFAAFIGEETEEDLLNQADVAMYGAKRRNRAVRLAAGD